MEIYVLWGFIIFAIILSCYAQIKVSSNYSKYSKIMASSGITAKELARRILNIAGMQDVEIIHVRGTMTDYFNPKKKVVALSDGVINSSSIAALGIVAHEVGHALQYKSGYFPIKLRALSITLSNIVSKLMWPILIIGVLLDIFIVLTIPLGLYFIYAVLGMFALTTLVSLVTLPVEFNASKRALKLLQDTNTLNESELEGAKAVLSSAGLTYVASFVGSLANLLRILFVLTRER